MEDSSVQRAFYKTFLDKNCYETKYVTTAEEGLKILNDFKPEIIILDFFLPGMNAPDFLYTIEKRNFSIPVIVATASDKKEDKAKCILQGAMAFLRKPFVEETLLTEIDMALENFEIKKFLKKIDFTDIDLEYISNLSNIGFSVGANKLGQLVDMIIKLPSPVIKVLPMEEILNIPIMKKEKITGLQIKFTGDLSGYSFLLMDTKDSENLFNFILGSDEGSKLKENDIIGEVGNIILNSLIGTISNQFKIRLVPHVPQFYRDSSKNIFGDLLSKENEWPQLINLSSHFRLMGIEFNCSISLIFDYTSLQRLRLFVRESIRDEDIDET